MKPGCELSTQVSSWEAGTQSGNCSFVGSSKHETRRSSSYHYGEPCLIFSTTLLMAFCTPKSFDTSNKKSLELGVRCPNSSPDSATTSWGPSIFSSRKQKQVEAMLNVRSRKKFWGRQAGVCVPTGSVATCMNWVESFFSESQSLGLGNGAELQYLPHKRCSNSLFAQCAQSEQHGQGP